MNDKANCEAMESILSEEFNGVFVEPDEDDNGRPDKADEKESLKDVKFRLVRVQP